MSMRVQEPKDYSDGRTKQAFKAETDINLILHRAQKAGTLSHLERFEGFYGDFEAFDFTDAQNQIARAGSMFAELPSEIRSEFNQSPQEFFDFVTAPENADKLGELLPALAAPGRQNIKLNEPEPVPVVVAAEPAVPAVPAVAPPAVPATPPPGGGE